MKKKKKTDPRIKRIIDYFHDTCLEIRGFKPIISDEDAKMVQRRLHRFSEKELQEEIRWFLESEIPEKLSCTLAISLSAFAFNKWLMETRSS